MKVAILDISVHGTNCYEPTDTGHRKENVPVNVSDGMGKVFDSLKARGYQILVSDRLFGGGFYTVCQSHLPGGGGEQWHTRKWDRREFYHEGSLCPNWHVVISEFKKLTPWAFA